MNTRKRIIMIQGALFVPCRHPFVTDPDVDELFKQPGVFDSLEETLIENHQKITAIPHESRGEVIRSLPYNPGMIQNKPRVLIPVDVEKECCLLVARYDHATTSCYLG